MLAVLALPDEEGAYGFAVGCLAGHSDGAGEPGWSATPRICSVADVDYLPTRATEICVGRGRH